MIARISLFIISMACMTTCFGLIWVQWHIRHELNTLRSQVHAVQTTDKVSPDALLKLQNQIDQVNKTFMDIKRGVDEFNKTIRDISTRITTLESKTSVLEKSVSTANDYINAPKNFQDLAKTVAELGSDLTNSKNDFDTRIKTLEASVKQSNPVNMDSVNQLLKPQLADLHQLVAAEFENMTKDLNNHSSRLSALESIAASSAQSISLNNATASVSNLYEQVSAALKDMSELNLSGNVTDRGEFLAFKLETLSNTEQINQTLYTLSDEFETLSTHINTIDSAILNISSALSTLKKQDN
ncbi:hypothetical protein Btru_040697 [Bulinus truncatus]|nr:hypothetical protein Btru_040697 [Bulinus truncatus]